MGRLFKQEGLIYQILNRIGDLILLNVLFLLTSLPVITIGASLSALFSVTLKMCRDEEGYLAGNYLRAFRENFRVATTLWLLFLLLFSLLLADLLLRGVLPEGLREAALLFYLALGLLLLMLLLYVFPQVAYFANTKRRYLLNAFYLAVRYLYVTVPMILLALLPLLAFYVGGSLLGIAVPFYLILGFALSAYVDSFLMRRIFDRLAAASGGPT